MKVAYSTTGQASPATVALDAKTAGISYGYLYRGDPARSPGHPDYVPQTDREDSASEQHPANAKAQAARKKRLAEYTRHRLAGKSKAEAVELTGLSGSAGREYERAFQRQQREAQP